MTDKKYLSFEGFITLAKQHYNQGGDGIVECWDRAAFEYWVKEFGFMTKKQALEIINLKGY